MSIFGLPCGCAIARSMFGMREITAVFHCPDHTHLKVSDNTLEQMAGELYALAYT